LLGVVGCETLARGLKHALRHPRPLATCEKLGLCQSFGMPSSHTALAVFVAVSRLLLLARNARSKGISTLLLGAVEAIALVSLAGAVGASRVYLGYHSTPQVYAAGVLGLAWALVWYTLLVCFSSSLDTFCTSWIGRAFHFKNTWALADVLSWERQQVQQQRSTTSRPPKAD
jgi:dolichyldiphosphatase